MKKLFVFSASLAAALLAACAGPQAPLEIKAPAPVQTENVMTVRSLVLPYDSSIRLETAFEQYGGCVPKTREWAEIEPGRVQFSCRMDDGVILQFDWEVRPGRDPKLKRFVYTSMNDPEYAGLAFLGPQAEEALKNVYENAPLF